MLYILTYSTDKLRMEMGNIYQRDNNPTKEICTCMFLHKTDDEHLYSN